MDVQFILKDKYRLAVLEELSGEDRSAEDISKRTHMPDRAIDLAVRDLMSEELIGGPTSSLHLTDKGRDMLQNVKNLEKLPGPEDEGAYSRTPPTFKGKDERTDPAYQGKN